MTDPRQDALLAQWLDDPSAGPPEGLDSDVVEAMIALRPELAPAPRVSLDDILAGVSEGPFARRSEAPVSTISDEELEARRSEMPVSQAEVVDLAAARRRRRRIWGGVGVFAAAAVVLFTILPEGEKFEAEVAAPAPAEQVLAPERQAKERSQEGVNPGKDLLEEGVGSELDPAPPPAAKPAQGAADAPELKAAETTSTYGPSPEEISVEEDEGYGDFDAAPRGAASKSAPSPSASPEPDWDDQDDWGGAEEVESVSISRPSKDRREESRTRAPSSSGGGLFGRADNTATDPAPMDEAEEAPATADMDALGYTEPSIPTDLDGLRAAAAPRDYNPNWYLRSLDGQALDDFSEAVDLATARASQGDYAGAASACAAMAQHGDPRIAQDMAFRAARYQVMAGDGGALATVRAGQRRSSANTPFRANLYQLEGQILEAQGDISGAKAAYTTAANLNAAR